MAEKIPVLIKQFNGGWNTEVISDALAMNMSPDLENVDFSASGSVKKTWGYEELSSDSEDAVNTRLMVVPDRQGVEWAFKKCGTKIKVHDSLLDLWLTIITGLTDGDTPVYEYFDGTVYFISAVDAARKLDLFKSTRLTADIILGASTINVDDTTAFDASGTFYLNNTLVTYTGKTGTSFTGCTGTPAALDNSLVFAPSVNVGGANQIPKGTITAQYAGRLFVADGSTLYGSKLVSLTDFQVAGSGTGDAIEKTIESRCNALKVFYDDQSNLRLMAFAANNKIYVLDVIDDADLSLTITTLSPFKDNVTALNQLSTLVGPNNLYHVDLRNQIRSLGQTYADNGVTKIFSDVMSKFHESLFKTKYNFDDAKAVIYGSEYWAVCREGDGTINNRLIIFDFEAGNWRLRTRINANDIAVYQGNVIFADAVSNKVYKFNELLYSDNDENLYFKYSTPDLDEEKLRFSRLRRVRVAGFISKNCVVTVKAYSDFKTKELGEFTISGDNNNITGALANGTNNSLGSVVFGDKVLGGEDTGIETRFFLADLQFDTCPDLENFRFVFENDQANVYFEITAIKPFIEQKPDIYWPSTKILKNN